MSNLRRIGILVPRSWELLNRKPDPNLTHWSFGCSHSHTSPTRESCKMLIYWSVPEAWPDTMQSHTSPTRESCKTQTSFYFLFQPSPELPFVFHGCVDFRHKCFLAFWKYDTKGWDLRPGGGQPFGSSLSKRLSSICKFGEHCWYAYKMATDLPTIRKRLTCKWRLGYFPSL